MLETSAVPIIDTRRLQENNAYVKQAEKRFPEIKKEAVPMSEQEEFSGFGDWLTTKMSEAKISNTELAGRVGVNRSYISLLRNGTRTPTADVVRQIASALDRPPAEALDLAGHDADTPIKVSGQEEVLRACLEWANVGYYEIGLDRRILHANATMLSLLKVASADEVIGRSLDDIVATVEPPARKKTIYEPVEENYPKAYLRIGSSPAKPFPALSRDYVVRDVKRRIRRVAIVVQDVSADDEVINILSDDEFFTSLVLTLPNCYVLKKDANRVFTFANENVLRELSDSNGRPLPESGFVGKRDAEFWPDAAARFAKDDERVLQEKAIIQTIELHEFQDEPGAGSQYVQTIKIPVIRSGRVTEIVIAYWKLKHHAEIKASLVRSKEEILRSILGHVPLVLYRKDTSLRVTYASPLYCEDLGREKENVVGKTDRDFFGEEYWSKYKQDDERVLNGETIEAQEAHRPLREGSSTDTLPEKYVEVRKEPIRDEEGRVVGLQGIFWDITKTRDFLVKAQHLITSAESALRVLSTDTANELQEISSKRRV